VAKKPSPNAKTNFPSDGPAYVSWAGTKAQEAESLQVYTNAIQEAATASQGSRTRDFSDLTTRLSGKPGLRNSDYDHFRPEQQVPEKPKDIIAFARASYRRIGLIRNAIDLMGDFACQGVRLVHPNKRVEKFYNDWFSRVQGKETSERLCNLLFREANVPIRMRTAKVNKQKRLEMQRSVASPDMNADIKISDFSKGELPWQYSFLDPLTLELVGGPLAVLSDSRQYMIKLPRNLVNLIRKARNSTDPLERDLLNQLSPEILQAAESNQSVLLPPEKTFVYFYKKDDWQEWADPMTYACFNDLILYERLKLADKTALDGAISKIRIFKLGSLDHKLAPTPAAASTLQSILGSNVGGGTTDIVWGPDIELLETGTDIQRFLGEEKYRPTLMAIYACLGIPPTLTGTFGATGTTNNFISLKTLTERLSYVRNTVLQFWNHQLKLVQHAMGFRFPAQVEFDFMYLDDPAAMTNLLLSMADRNIVSDEFVQRHIKAKPEIEQRRVMSENKSRDTKKIEKVSPYHAVDKQHSLEKIALQTGIVSPSQVGVELKDKNGDESALEMRRPHKQDSPSESEPPNNDDTELDDDNRGGGEPGRPKNSRDVGPRKTKEFKPKNKAAVELWAKGAQDKLSEILNPGLLKQFNKKNMRSLTLQEFNQAEQIKFSVLYYCDYLQPINHSTISQALSQKLPNGVLEECESWINNAADDMDRKLSIDEIRNIRAAFYAEQYTSEGKYAYRDVRTGQIYYYSRIGVYKKNGRVLVLVHNP
tara:strand:- start:23668 stop:25956 length:2289 start_codon:yes stop_codon:yes gene_type:complete